MIFRIFLMACFVVSFAQAQDIQYVFAENGLVVREKPNQGANKVGLLDYGTAVEVLEHTNLNLDIQSNNSKITGEWVKIRGTEADEFFDEGYVFNGFLTEDRIESPLKVPFDAFTIFVDAIDRHTEFVADASGENSATYNLASGESPENRYIKVKHHQNYRTIEVFQRLQNSIIIKGDDIDCDLVDFNTFNSSWKLLRMLPNSGNIYKTKQFSKTDYKRFSEINMDELKTYVSENCGDEWSTLLVETTSVNEKPIAVKANEIHLRVVMTDIDGYKTEKIIVFKLNKDS